ncbi:hypothetical protein [Bacillus pseudomycoides]|uniref:hypothetical protein n=1 Tax=Bacillus pseudomycoides TaxID=64104 RepID=UPI001FB4E3F8|nr:hypothetical protein [Bacillus pseudomycoides]
MIKQFYEDGVLLDSFSQGNPEEDMLKDAELFTTGIHRGRNYTKADLQRLALAFSPEEETPLQLNHSESVKDTVGFLDSVQVVGEKLMGKVRIIDEDTKERVDKKLAKKLSISFYTDKQGNPNKIREVSLVAFPQIKSAQLFREQSPLAELSRKMTALQLQVNHQLQFNETRLLAQQLEQDINKLTKEFSKREAPKKLTEEERTKQAQEEFDKFYEGYKKQMKWSN